MHRLFKNLVFLSLLISFSISKAQDKEFTCINIKGEKIFSVKAKSVSAFSDGLAEIKKTVIENNNPVVRSGFVNEKGELVIAARYEKVRPFSNGVTWVKEPGNPNFYLINKRGEKQGTSSWIKTGNFSEGFCQVFDENDKMGFVNRKGELIIPCNFVGGDFSEGKVCLMPFNSKDGKFGFMDTTGKLVLPYRYKQNGFSTFKNGEAVVFLNSAKCIINHKGEVIFKPTISKNCYGFVHELSVGYGSDGSSGWGYYNRKNEWVIKPQYDNAWDFKYGFAFVVKRGKVGVIDTTGKLIVPFNYEKISGGAVETGYFEVSKAVNANNKEKEYLNLSGQAFTTVPVKTLFIANGHSIVPFCSPENTYGYLTLDGVIFLNATFEKTESFSENKAWVLGDVSALTIAEGTSADAFVREFVLGEKIQAKKRGGDDFIPGVIKELSEHYHLVVYENGEQEWVPIENIKR